MKWIFGFDGMSKVVAAFLSFAALSLDVASAETSATTTIFVPRSVIYPGDVISEEFLVERKIFASQGVLPFGSAKEDVVGKVARRTLVPGQPIPASAVRNKEAVIQGRSYDILYRSGALTITGAAVPLQSAAVGETVNVRNPDSGIVVKAVVQPGGMLLVTSK